MPAVIRLLSEHGECSRQMEQSACSSVRADLPGCRGRWNGGVVGESQVCAGGGCGAAVKQAPVRNFAVHPAVWGGSGQGVSAEGLVEKKEEEEEVGDPLFAAATAGDPLLPGQDTATPPGNRSYTLTPSGGATPE